MKCKKIITLCTGVMLLGAALTGCAPTITQGDVDAAYDKGVASVVPVVVEEVTGDITINDADVIAAATIDKTEEIDRLNQVVEDYKSAATEIKIEQEVSNAYLLNDLEISKTFTETFSDREVDKLFDGKIKFDGDRYDIEEVFYIQATVGVNEEDYNAETYLQIAEDDMVYEIVFESGLDTSKIDEDETIKFNFLGKEVEVSDWDVDEITFTTGQVKFVAEGEVISVNGKTFFVEAIGESGSTGYIKVVVDGESEILKTGETEQIAGIEINVRDILINDEPDQPDFVELKIGTDVEFEVQDGDNYDLDDRFEWIVDSNLLGLKLVEDMIQLDDDYKPLAAGETVCLPEEFICVKYNGLDELDMQTLKFSDDNDYDVEVRGDFAVGLENYDKVYVNATGIYNKDDELLGQDVEIENCDESLVLKNSKELEVEGFVLQNDFSDLVVDGNSLISIEDDYLSLYGLIINNPEDDLEDKDISLDVPEEKSLASIGVY